MATPRLRMNRTWRQFKSGLPVTSCVLTTRLWKEVCSNGEIIWVWILSTGTSGCWNFPYHETSNRGEKRTSQLFVGVQVLFTHDCRSEIGISIILFRKLSYEHSCEQIRTREIRPNEIIVILERRKHIQSVIDITGFNPRKSPTSSVEWKQYSRPFYSSQIHNSHLKTVYKPRNWQWTRPVSEFARIDRRNVAWTFFTKPFYWINRNHGISKDS